MELDHLQYGVITEVPEPSSIAVFLIIAVGLFGFLLIRRISGMKTLSL
jgi:hypothetical protein